MPQLLGNVATLSGGCLPVPGLQAKAAAPAGPLCRLPERFYDTVRQLKNDPN